MSEVNLSENLLDQTRKETNEIFSDLVNGRYDENDSDNQSTQTNSELQENRPKNNLIYNYLLPGKEKSYHIDSNNFVRKEKWTKKTVSSVPEETENSNENPIENHNNNNSQIMTHNGKGNILLVDKARNGNVVLALFKDLNNNTYHLRFYVLKNNINYDTNSHRSSNIYNHPFINNSFNFNNHHNNGCNNSSEGEA